jgi:putative DNA primase/helicase
VQINPKNQIRRKETNHINVGFLSNEIQPLALDNTDRRYLVIYTPLPHPFEYYRKLGQWRDDGGTEAFYRYLLDYPLEGFEPYAPAPYTKAKEDLIDLNRKSSERFWREWHGGELDLPYWSCSAAQAYQAYLKYCQRTGERYPVQRPQFTRQVLRMSEIARSPMSERVMAVDQEEGSERKNKSVRMLLTEAPPDGVKLGVFATTSVQKFTPELQRYLGVGFHSSSPSGGGSGSDD